jgi:HEAT repeat protein
MELFPRFYVKKKIPPVTVLIVLTGLSFFERLNWGDFFGPDVKKLARTRNLKGLIHALRHKDPKIQYDAAEALGEIGGIPAIGPLIAALTENELSGVRWKAAEALSKIGAPAVDALIGALQHNDDDVRWKAAIALGEIGDPRAIEPLISLLCDDDRFVKGRAAFALGLIGKPAVEPLILALREGDGNLRWGAAIALGKIRDPLAIEPLIRALADKYENVRAESALSLAAIGKPAFEPLLRFLKYSDRSTRIEVVTALGGLKDTDAIQPLMQVLETADEDERVEIADALDAILIPSIEPLSRRIRNGNTQRKERTISGNNDGGEG